VGPTGEGGEAGKEAARRLLEEAVARLASPPADLAAAEVGS
jgi:hypothetical protein